ncbi:hypothetical protein OY671_008918 [Metschnikowia pulcherrima]|nr:hypothetical protein OY671_008918 [Metschnikowia pulcherrima]
MAVYPATERFERRRAGGVAVGPPPCLQELLTRAYKIIDEDDRPGKTVRQSFNHLSRLEKSASIDSHGSSSLPCEQPAAVGRVRILSLDDSDESISAEISPARRRVFETFEIVGQQVG